MKRRLLIGLLCVQTLAIAGLAGALLWHERDAEPARSQPPAERAAPAGRLTVRLDAAVQQASGLQLARLAGAQAPAAEAAWGQVLASPGLTEARLRLRQAALDIEQWDPQLARARQEYERQEGLWRAGGNVARRVVDLARNDLGQLEQRRQAALELRAVVRDAVRAEWGGEILAALEASDGGVLAGVLAGSQRVLLIAGGASATGEIALAEQPEVRIAARRIGPATQAEGSSAAASWYWLAPAQRLRAGQRVRLTAPPVAGGRPGAAGVRVPESAVVWQAGQAWIYVQRDREHFERRAAALGDPLPGGWWMAKAQAPDAPIVTQGAQLLLSEESRAQIRNENGD